MRIEIRIPKEFEEEFVKDCFTDSIRRIESDIDTFRDKNNCEYATFYGLSGKYESETLSMIKEAMQGGKILPEKRSRWIIDEKRFGDADYHCEKCGAILEGDNLVWRNNYYCYHCGAEMERG